MKRVKIKDKNNIISVECYEGESIETKVRRILDENEPIKDGAPIIYTEMKDGVLPEFNIRTDRWEIAMQAMDKVNSYQASQYLKNGEIGELNKENETKAELKIEPKTEAEAS